MERKRSVRRRQKPPFERVKDHCRAFTAFMFSNVGITFLVVLYIIGGKLRMCVCPFQKPSNIIFFSHINHQIVKCIGAYMFKAIEQESSRVMKDTAADARKSTAQKLWSRACDVNTFSYEEFSAV